jgi:hypothetical protein
MRRALRVLALLGLVGVGGAWGQVNVDNNCSVYDAALNKNIAAYWSGICANGLISGYGILKFVSDSGFVYISSGNADAGKRLDLWVNYSRSEYDDIYFNYFSESDGKYLAITLKNKKTTSLLQALENINFFYKEKTPMTREFQTKTINSYYQNPVSFITKYAEAKANSEQYLSDPKVFGRSARGG